jgi:hypothetical protein
MSLVADKNDIVSLAHINLMCGIDTWNELSRDYSR